MAYQEFEKILGGSWCGRLHLYLDICSCKPWYHHKCHLDINIVEFVLPATTTALKDVWKTLIVMQADEPVASLSFRNAFVCRSIEDRLLLGFAGRGKGDCRCLPEPAFSSTVTVSYHIRLSNPWIAMQLLATTERSTPLALIQSVLLAALWKVQDGALADAVGTRWGQCSPMQVMQIR